MRAIVSLECVLPLNSDILKSHLQPILREGSNAKGGRGWSSEGTRHKAGIAPFLNVVYITIFFFFINSTYWTQEATIKMPKIKTFPLINI